MKCPDCERDFPEHLLQEMAVANAILDDTDEPGGEITYSLKCPLCALRIVNEIHGLPAGTPFRGPKAALMYRQAVAHLVATNQRTT